VLCSIQNILQSVQPNSCLVCTLCPLPIHINGCMQGVGLAYPIASVNISRETYRVHLTVSKAMSMTAATDNNVVGNCGPETLWRMWFPNRRLSSKRLLLKDRHFTLLYFRSAQKNSIRRLIQDQEKINTVPTKAAASLAHTGEIGIPTPEEKRWRPAKATNMTKFTPSKRTTKTSSIVYHAKRSARAQCT
jgi:hypothetical protein